MSKPKVRFKGYQDEWEQRKLGDVYYTLNVMNEEMILYKFCRFQFILVYQQENWMLII